MDTELDMAENKASGMNPVETIWRRMKQLELEIKALLRKLQSMEHEALNLNPMEMIMRQVQQMQMKADALEKELKNMQQKKENIDRVVAMLEKPKKHDGTLDYLEILRAEIDAGGADLSVYADLAKTGASYSKR